MNCANVIGSLAAVCTTIAFIPQIARIRRMRRADELSMPMYVIFSIGVFLWLCYGLILRSIPIISANSITLAVCLYIMRMKLKYK